MLLTISTTHRPATDLAEMLGQHPDDVRAATFPFGYAMVCFSQADAVRCTAALMLQHPGRPARAGLLADVVADLFGAARAADGPPMALEVDSPMLPCVGGRERLWAVFSPLGYHVTTTPVVGSGPDEVAVKLTTRRPLGQLLNDLCTQLPALDGALDPHARRARSGASAHQ